MTSNNSDFGDQKVLGLEQLGMNDVPVVGGKNASLGEMISNLSNLGVNVPGGFATTADAYREFLDAAGLTDKINNTLNELDVDDVNALASCGKNIRQWVVEAPLPADLETEVRKSYKEMATEGMDATVAVRSSATAEDLPDASFAGQQETFLNIKGINQVLHAIKLVFASLFNDRAISYRVHQGFDHAEVALSAGIQMMVRSDLASSGVMFSIDTESGFEDVVFITGSYGLGETVVQGAVNPDEFYVYKKSLSAGKKAILQKNRGSKMIKMIYAQEEHPEHAIQTVSVDVHEQKMFCISDEDINALAVMAMTIEKHYQRPMDIEWAKDGLSGELFIVQARPETVVSREGKVIERYVLKERSKFIVEGRAVGNRIGQGKAKVITDLTQMDQIEQGDVLVTDMTDPDWEPVMKKASAIVTNRGGRTCHAAIIAREMGIPALVGCGDATRVIQHGADITVSCAEGDTGFVYSGMLKFEHQKHELSQMPDIPVKVMMNVGNPERAFSFARLPHKGVGLARLEFIINKMIGIHPKALLNFEQMNVELQQVIHEKINGYNSPVDYYVDRLSEGIATLGAAYAPERVIVRLSDFKSNEYAHLIGGEIFEPEEENPMIGYRGASRYISEEFQECFALECEAIKRVRLEMGIQNVEIMIPFVRTLEEADGVIKLLKQNGLERGKDGLKIIMMCELPSNVLLADEFLEFFDGFSIGSNDLTQLTLGLDRDSGLIAHSFDERNPAVMKLLEQAINACKKAGKYVGICGQGPSDHPDLAKWLLEQGIDSVSLNPDTVVDTWLFMADQKN
ncbi:MAG: phosphoenolpyruvate synthase [Gammaproteobacteria bacterium]|jgi:pyruvate,water dikinase|nr:phosphoenolpyruvate synthase [Gammaproteobacteria bacterium]MBT4078422.1 phosphoenolpyruvate synthase [Gammaproteobacteria bacterium]MBT4196188.1 phosphoenolpyruvate synthase [Gammaproteobacteria bacterium]MBT4448315.1 phosphoenolpyruvate synthase [Gammaproteobacteria bacterium]MBT4862706.1 phosphoenolpyruvate synthase [Gammaproteobacteria bacterium]